MYKMQLAPVPLQPGHVFGKGSAVLKFLHTVKKKLRLAEKKDKYYNVSIWKDSKKWR